MHTLANPIGPDTLLSGSSALVVLAVVLFAECGLLLGFFLPGDTLLFAAGISIATGTITTSFAAFLVVAPIAAVAGNLVGYAIGYRAGPVVFDRPRSRLFRPEYVERSTRFYDRFGPRTILIGRFVPIVRTVATVMAGVGRMPFARYAIYSVVGGILWSDGMLLLGHALGHVAFVRRNKGYIDYLVVLVVVLSLLPVAVHYVQGRRRPRAGHRAASDPNQPRDETCARSPRAAVVSPSTRLRRACAVARWTATPSSSSPSPATGCSATPRRCSARCSPRRTWATSVSSGRWPVEGTRPSARNSRTNRAFASSSAARRLLPRTRTRGYLINNATFPQAFAKRRGPDLPEHLARDAAEGNGLRHARAARVRVGEHRSQPPLRRLPAGTQRRHRRRCTSTPTGCVDLWRGRLLRIGTPRIDRQFADRRRTRAHMGAPARRAAPRIDAGARIVLFAPTWRGFSPRPPTTWTGCAGTSPSCANWLDRARACWSRCTSGCTPRRGRPQARGHCSCRTACRRMTSWP